MATLTEDRSSVGFDAGPESPSVVSPFDDSSPEDLLGGMRWSGQRLLVVASALLLLDALAGWLYEASYFGYFRIPLDALGLSVWEVLGQGARLFLLPLTVIPVAFVAGASSRPIRQGALVSGGYVLFLALMAFVSHLLSPILIPVECAAAIVIASAVFMLRRGFGLTTQLRLILGPAAFLLVISLAVASGILDAGQTASPKQSTLRIVTRDAALPGSTVDGIYFGSSSYILLRETDSRYWLLGVNDHNTYSIAKTDVLYVRY